MLCGFRPSLGGMVCSECYPQHHEDCFSISPQGLAALHDLLDHPLSEIGGLELDGFAAAEVERAISQTLAHHAH
jgi:hypothetical protein